MASVHLTLANRMEELPRLDREAAAFLETVGASPAAGYAVSLALEELVTNIIKYGYDDMAGHEIGVDLAWDGGALRLTVRDDGHHFDPLTAPPPDLELSVEDRPIGGLGLHLVRQFFPDVRYRRENDGNVLELCRPADCDRAG